MKNILDGLTITIESRTENGQEIFTAKAEVKLAPGKFRSFIEESTRDYAAVAAVCDLVKKQAIANLKTGGM
jgi:hypothetical protein